MMPSKCLDFLKGGYLLTCLVALVVIALRLMLCAEFDGLSRSDLNAYGIGLLVFYGILTVIAVAKIVRYVNLNETVKAFFFGVAYYVVSFAALMVIAVTYCVLNYEELDRPENLDTMTSIWE